jgi:hypothetical protein
VKSSRRSWLAWLPLWLLAAAGVACALLPGASSPTKVAVAGTPLPATVVAPTTPLSATPTPAVSTVTPSATPTLADASATPSPTPSTAAAATTAAPAGGAPCVIVVRTPLPSAPTEVGGRLTPPRQIDPHIELCASATTLKVGGTLILAAQAVDVGLPYYSVLAQDAGAAQAAVLVQITFENNITASADVSHVLALVEARANGNNLTVSLRARAAGQVQLSVAASGEVHYGYPGPATMAGGGSVPLSITVTN